ncbi:concanavalin A-like lectin/glucanase domain-containing protein [Fimicolochytrium jonesii]|uniref:concanavalin A-like lectin/glucanase domain-containing protein n=1 Tax=Fimicolochytrium jonesii TaxID=1396493 RepID=UPI0022FE84F2|nr:concanavalin A-like lectin/glucanase domain-containing protein [Fimicolochytrium jonesii]KAI8819212.1 concanavalin A-like lectin/glucanase domain-containing protein [Fimicolochytrium jonesii]
MAAAASPIASNGAPRHDILTQTTSTAQGQQASGGGSVALQIQPESPAVPVVGNEHEAQLPSGTPSEGPDKTDPKRKRDTESQMPGQQPPKAKRQRSALKPTNDVYPLEESTKSSKKSKPTTPDDSQTPPPDLANAVYLYPDDDNPRTDVVMSKQPIHRAPQMALSDEGLTVMCDSGYRMAKASHGVWEGKWYYEVLVNEHSGHTRIGWSQISGDLQAPCGYDQFSYGYRDEPGTLFHCSAKVKDAPSDYANGYGPGDVLGMAISLPQCSDMADLVQRLWNPYKDYVAYPSEPPEPVDGSEISYYKNGKPLGIAFRKLLKGKYYPAISSYRGGSVTLNFGPEFRCPPPPGFSPMFEAKYLVSWTDIAAGIVKWDGVQWRDVRSESGDADGVASTDDSTSSGSWDGPGSEPKVGRG